MKDDGARGAEITVEDGELPYCPDCQVKHAADLVAHIDPAEKEKYARAQWIFDKASEQAGISKTQQKDYAVIRELEHKFEDGLTVLRDLRHKVQASPAIDNPAHGLGKCERKIEKCVVSGHSEEDCRAAIPCK